MEKCQICSQKVKLYRGGGYRSVEENGDELGNAGKIGRKVMGLKIGALDHFLEDTRYQS